MVKEITLALLRATGQGCDEGTPEATLCLIRSRSIGVMTACRLNQ